MISLANGRIDVAMDTAANNMSVDIYSDGALSNQIGGLVAHHGGRHRHRRHRLGHLHLLEEQVQEVTGDAAYATLKTTMNALWLKAVRGTDKPDVIVSTHDLFAMYEGRVTGDSQRPMDSKMAGLGFENLKYKSAPIIFDDNTNFGTTDELMYFLNTKYTLPHGAPRGPVDRG